MDDAMDLLVDLDGTLAVPAPQLAMRGYRLVLYTSRPQEEEPEIQRWCRRVGLPVARVVCGKPQGILIDDLSISPLDISGPGELVLRVQELAKRLGEIRDLYRLGMRIARDTADTADIP